MHELLLYGATAFGGTASLWFARLRWLRRRRRAEAKVGERIRHWGPLPLAGGGTIASRDLRDKRAVVLVFMSNRCPGVKAYDSRLRRLAEHFGSADVQFVGVNSIDARHYPGEGLQAMEEAVQDRELPFPYGKDEGQELAAAMGAVCTPHVFLIDAGRRLRYQGRIDDRLVEARAKRAFLADAIEDVLADRAVRRPQTAPVGCSIEFTRGSQERRATASPRMVRA